MTLAFSGIRFNEDPFDPTWDNYTLARELQARAMNAWAESEQALRDAQSLFGLEPEYLTNDGIKSLDALMEEHIPNCALAGYFVGRYKIGAESPPLRVKGELLAPGKLPYTITDYLIREAFKTGRMEGLRWQSCVEGPALRKELQRFRDAREKLRELRNDVQHGKTNWTKEHKIAQCLVWYNEFIALRTRALHVYGLAMEVRTGNHFHVHHKPDFYRSHYSSDEVGVYAKERAESFSFRAFLERKQKEEHAAFMLPFLGEDDMDTLVEWKPDGEE